MTYLEAKKYMDEVQKRGSVLGLNPVKNLLNHLGNPQEQLNVIHVAGTNGKGSICTFLECLYLGECKSVGRYISPTLHCYLERFQINKTYMSEEEFADIFTSIYPVLCDMEINGEPMPTAFEIETVIAFVYFVRHKVNVVILETGMGGRLDATNVVSKPRCTVFTSIGMDHMQFLGDSIEQIAYEKAGIIKDDTPCVCYPNAVNVNDVLLKEYSLHNIDAQGYHLIDLNDLHILSEDLHGSTFLYKDVEYTIPLAGRYQIYNAAVAIETKLVLDGEVNAKSLFDASWEGRFELISDNPIFIKDGAHNIDGVNALKESIQKHFTNHNLIFIIGVLRDKEYEQMMQILCPFASDVCTVTPAVERGLDAKCLKEAVLPYCDNVTVCDSVHEAVDYAKQLALRYIDDNKQAAIVAWGSLSYIGEIVG